MTYGKTLQNKVVNSNSLMDAMYYLDPDSRTDPQLARGVITGLVSAFMVLGLDFESAVNLIIKTMSERNAQSNRPTYVIKSALLPDCWLQEFTAACKKYRVNLV